MMSLTGSCLMTLVWSNRKTMGRNQYRSSATITSQQSTDIVQVLRGDAVGNRKRVDCPKSIAGYNTGGVDRFDAMMAVYSISWKSRLMYILIDLSVVNSFIAYSYLCRTKNKVRNLSHLEYRSSLANGLIETFCSRKRPRQLQKHQGEERKTDLLATQRFPTLWE